MNDIIEPIQLALQIMDDWLYLPEEDYTADVYWFAQRLPPESVLDAVESGPRSSPGHARRVSSCTIS